MQFVWFLKSRQRRKRHPGRGYREANGKFCPWKKLSKEGKQVPQKLPGVLTPRKVDNSVTSDSGRAPAQQNKNIGPNILMNQIV